MGKAKQKVNQADSEEPTLKVRSQGMSQCNEINDLT